MEALHHGGHAAISLAAVVEAQVVSPVLFGRLTVCVDGRAVRALSLAPIGVRPAYHNRGVGSTLIREGHALALRDGWQAAIMVGDQAYYGRFGYRSGTVAHIASPYAGAHLMGLEFEPGALAGTAGDMTYAPPFAAL